MNKSHPVRRIAVDTGLTRQNAKAAFNAMPSSIAGSLARGQAVSHLGFGTFGMRRRPARMGHNPRSGETLDISASTMAAFKIGKPLRDAVDAGGS